MKRFLLLILILSGCQKHINITPRAGSGRSVDINWTASTTVGVTYNVYRFSGTCASSGTGTKLNSSPVTGLTYTDSDVPVGTLCYWATSYLVAAQSQESIPSNKAEVTVISQPNPPTNLTITPPTVTMQIGTTQQFMASISGASWSISPVDVGSIDSNGLYTAPQKIQGNNVQVQVIARNLGQVATAQVTVRKN